MSYTITEALQEIKTIGKRIDTKTVALTQYIVRDSRAKDPFAKDGGSEEFLKREFQSIKDLEIRLVAIRTNIQVSNIEKQITVQDITKSVFEWLTWRREVAPKHDQFLRLVTANIKNVRDKLQKEGRTLVSASKEDVATPTEVIINVNEKELLEQIEKHEIIISELDGKLSLANATTFIDI